MSAGKAGVRVGLVNVDLIDFHPHNVRRDLGDLRSLTESIRKHGVLQPVVLEQRGARLRLRAGHRRTVATRMSGRKMIPAIVHSESLEMDEWLVNAVQENVMRRDLSIQEKVDAIRAMTREGMTRDGIAEAFGVTPSTIRAWERQVTGESVAVHESVLQVRAEEREAKVAELTQQGHSAREIAAIVGISQKHVVRLRTGSNRERSSIGRPKLRELTATLRERVDRDGWTTADVLAALDAFTQDFTVPSPTVEQRAA